MITRAEQDSVEHVLEEACRFVRYKHADGRWAPTDVPFRIARRLLAKAAKWSDIPILTGIVEGPMLRPDGSVLEEPGYDPHIGLLLDPGGIEFPALPKSPTREEALAALKIFTGGAVQVTANKPVDAVSHKSNQDHAHINHA